MIPKALSQPHEHLLRCMRRIRLKRISRGPLSLPHWRAGSHAWQSIVTRSRQSRTVALKVVAMRSVVQRVRSASVEVEGKIVAEIGPGLLCLIGIRDVDTAKDQDYMCVGFLWVYCCRHLACNRVRLKPDGPCSYRSRKILNFRVWPNSENNKKAWDESVSVPRPMRQTPPMTPPSCS